MNDFGYEAGAPCIAVKMNRVFEFMPDIEGNGQEILVECIGEDNWAFPLLEILFSCPRVGGGTC